MKFIITLLALSVTAYSSAQDTATHQGYKFYKGLETQLGYGSDANKNFVFVWKGNKFDGLKKLPSEWSGTKLVIDEIVKGYNGKLWLRSGKVWIDLEGAVDFKEIRVH